MQKKNNKKKFLIIGLLLVVIGLGYAFLNANLKINGISNIGNVKWEVYFENSALTEENTLAGAAAPVIEQGTKPTEIGYNVTFNTPGEVYEFTVDVKNGGTIDATVSSITSSLKVGNQDEVEIAADKSNLPTYLDYDLTDEDGNAITLPFDLAKTEHKTLKLRLTFKQDITAEQLAQAVEDSTIRFNMMMKSRQKGAPDEGEIIDENTKYAVTNEFITLNQEIPAGVNLRNTPALAMNDWIGFNPGYGAAEEKMPFYLKFKMENNLPIESYVEVVIDDEFIEKDRENYVDNCNNDEDCINSYVAPNKGTYTFRGGVDESSSYDNRPIYDSNVATLYRIYNEENCNFSGYTLECSSAYNGWQIGLYTFDVSYYGDIDIRNDYWFCDSYESQYSYCGFYY